MGFSSHTRRDRAMRAAANLSSKDEGKKKSRRASSEEPPAKKRHKDMGAGGPRPTHKSSVSVGKAASTGARTPSSTRPSPLPYSRWDAGPRQAASPSTGPVTQVLTKNPSTTDPSTIRAHPSTTKGSKMAPSTREHSSTTERSSTKKPPLTVRRSSTEESTLTEGRSSTSRQMPSTAAPSTAQKSTPVRGTRSPSTDPSTEKWKSPALQVESSEEPESRPRVGYKTVPSKAASPPQEQGSLREAMSKCLLSMKDMVQKHQVTLDQAKVQLEAQQADARLDKHKEQEKFRKVLEEQREAYQREIELQRAEADRREQARMELYAAELEELRGRLPQLKQKDPIQEFQEKELRTLRQSQGIDVQEEEGYDEEPEEEPLGDPDEAHSDQENDQEEDHEGMEEPEFPRPGPAYVPKPSPPEDAPSFVALINRAAAHFRLPLEKTEPSTSYLLAKLDEPVKTITALPIEPLLWESGKEIMRAPASTPAVSARSDKKYRVPSSAPKCFRGQPDPESIISTSAKGASQVPSHMLSPPTKDARRLDNMGKKVLAAASCQVRTANYTAVLSRYDRDMWDRMSEMLSDLPEDKRESAERTLAEGRIVSNNLLKAALDSADAGFRQMNHGVWLRRMGWLGTSAFNADLHHRILDLPFDGEHVFGPDVDRVLLEQKTYKETIKAMTPLTRPRGSFRGNNRRGNRRGYPQAYPQQQQQQTPYQTQYQAQYQQPPPQRGFQQTRQGGRPRRGGGGRGQRAQTKPQ